MFHHLPKGGERRTRQWLRDNAQGQPSRCFSQPPREERQGNTGVKMDHERLALRRKQSDLARSLPKVLSLACSLWPHLTQLGHGPVTSGSAVSEPSAFRLLSGQSGR